MEPYSDPLLVETMGMKRAIHAAGRTIGNGRSFATTEPQGARVSALDELVGLNVAHNGHLAEAVSRLEGVLARLAGLGTSDEAKAETPPLPQSAVSRLTREADRSAGLTQRLHALLTDLEKIA